MVPLMLALLAFAGNGQNDTYAIYSLLFTNAQKNDGADRNPVYLTADTTVDAGLPVSCIVPPPDRKAQFAEVLADFAARKNEHTRLVRELNISRPYRYLDRAQVEEFQLQAGSATNLFSLGNVYFDRDRTLALTNFSSWCGGLCGTFTWHVFERNKDGKWESRNWVSCFAVA